MLRVAFNAVVIFASVLAFAQDRRATRQTSDTILALAPGEDAPRVLSLSNCVPAPWNYANSRTSRKGVLSVGEFPRTVFDGGLSRRTVRSSVGEQRNGE